jgi:hypothetical protein
MTLRRSLLWFAIIFFELSSFSSSAYGWGPKGHEIVAYIAEAHLTDAARKQVNAILRLRDATLAKASTWPDEVAPTIPDMNPYHFINFPNDANKYDRQRDCRNRNCIIEALAWYERVLTSEDAPFNERRIALRFIVHLVGDVHQPLHAGFRTDRGGNTVIVVFKGQNNSLHSLWDNAFVELEDGTSREVAARLDQAVTPEERREWQRGTAADWALESLTLVRSHVYSVPESREITADYAKRAQVVVRRRLAQAGMRLAWLLNGLLR